MDNAPDDVRSRSKESKDSAYPPSTTFKGDSLTRAKKLRSPVRSNEFSSSVPTPIPALVVYEVDDETPSYEHHEHYEDENDADDDGDDEADEDEDDVSDSGSSTPRASRQSFGLTSPPPAYVTSTTADRPSTPRASRPTDQEQDDNSLSQTLLPARAYSPPGEDRWCRRRGHGHGRNESVSSMTTIKPAKSEQEVLDAMIDDLSREQQQGEAGDHEVYKRGTELKPARSLRRERRQGRD
ncbi:hypothetical protein EIK77_001341 [Talaromyces pinophilus]|nr:hypothetical protein EIK77_001341 [Talaromyces pinophilus]PCG90603.1 Hypothetical protein PENO1_098300 [Penicillium occitanis (nom. inval.)]PCG94281.1 hypothetical protein PENOC_083430 [Penicillium occitanis (nom. inval.)]